MLKLLLVLILLFFTVACNKESTVNFEIKNNSQYNIDSLSVKVSSGNYINFIIIESGKSSFYKIDMSNIPKTDGSYYIKYNLNGKSFSYQFGYYTNGYPLEKLIRIEIKTDTLLVK